MIADVLLAQGDLTGALAIYRAALVGSERLAAQDPTDAFVQRNLPVVHNKVGDVLQAQGGRQAASLQGKFEALRRREVNKRPR